MRKNREGVVCLPQHYLGQIKSLLDTPRCGTAILSAIELSPPLE